MLTIHSKTFNPELLYVFDSLNKGAASGKEHSHDFFELSILLHGESFYVIDNESYYLDKPSVLVLNPGVSHMEYVSENMENIQIHIGLRDFNFSGFQRDFMPFSSKIIQLNKLHGDFFETCEEIIRERREAKTGYKLILKSLVYKLIVYLLRDEETTKVHKTLDTEDQEKQAQVNDIKLFIENHYNDELTLDTIADSFYISSATLSRDFKEFIGDTPINFLIHYRLEQAKNLLKKNQELTVKEVAMTVGYDDPLYFSKIFKKHYSYSPSFLTKNKK